MHLEVNIAEGRTVKKGRTVGKKSKERHSGLTRV